MNSETIDNKPDAGGAPATSREGVGESDLSDGGAAGLVDIGVNLGHRRFDHDFHDVILRAQEKGVSMMVVTGTNLKASEAAKELADRYPDCLCSTAGVHPHDASSWSAQICRAVEQLAGKSSVVAVGECGLDFNRDFSPRDKQEEAFSAQLEIAARTGKPAFMHERDAHERFVNIVREHRDSLAGGVLHCFTGTAEELDRYLDLDLHIGITGWICDERRGHHLVDLVKRIPQDRLMIETDSPFLTPRTLRPKPKGGRNEPAFLPVVLEAVAGACGRSLQDVAKTSSETSRAFFGLPIPT